MSELNRTSSVYFSKFMLELKKYGEQFPQYSVGDILYSLNRELNKQEKSLLEITKK